MAIFLFQLRNYGKPVIENGAFKYIEEEVEALSLASAQEIIKQKYPGVCKADLDSGGLLIEEYQGRKIVLIEGCYNVVSPDFTRLVVGLDDSKIGGNRKFVQSSNNVESAREYIDWCNNLHAND